MKEVFILNSKYVLIVLELMDSDLGKFIQDPDIVLEQRHIKCIFKQILEGLAVLHENWILHRDIKPQNMLIDNKGIIKHTDFGFAKQFAMEGN